MSVADHTSTDSTGAPLAGRSVLVTRSREQSNALAGPLEALGAEVLAFPVIEVVDPLDTSAVDDAAAHVADYDWLVLTSTNGVERFFGRPAMDGRLPAALAGVRTAAVGSATAERMRSHGVEPDFVPADFRAEGLVSGFADRGVGAGSRVLIARAEEAREILPDELRAMGAEVDVVVTYRVVEARPEPRALERLAAGAVDVATFASGGTFRRFLSVLETAGLDAGTVTRSLAIASVGPVTSVQIREFGYEVSIEADESTMDSLASAIARYFHAS